MRAVKAVQIPYQPSDDVLSLLEAFRNMVNYCIHIGLERNITQGLDVQTRFIMS